MYPKIPGFVEERSSKVILFYIWNVNKEQQNELKEKWTNNEYSSTFNS